MKVEQWKNKWAIGKYIKQTQKFHRKSQNPLGWLKKRSPSQILGECVWAHFPARINSDKRVAKRKQSTTYLCVLRNFKQTIERDEKFHTIATGSQLLSKFMSCIATFTEWLKIPSSPKWEEVCTMCLLDRLISWWCLPVTGRKTCWFFWLRISCWGR